MWKVEVESPKIETKNGTSAKTGRTYSIREQEAWLYAYDGEGKLYKHAQRIKLTLPDDQPAAYVPGQYYVHPGSVYVDKYSQASIKTRLMSLTDFQAWLRTSFLPSVTGSASVTAARAA